MTNNNFNGEIGYDNNNFNGGFGYGTLLMVVTITQEVEVKILSRLMFRNWMAQITLNGPKLFDLF